jgi:hydroxymethylbilane synthase
MATDVLRIGTRGSPLALRQTSLVVDRLRALHPRLAPLNAIETIVIKTTGDRVQNVLLAQLGGKGLFTKELDEALIENRIDLAIHSMKDVPTFLPAGIQLTSVLPREDTRDVLVSSKGDSLAALPKGAVVGTASARRRAQVLSKRPDVTVKPLRGNVETRIAKIAAGEADATLLAYAGLKRLGKESAAAAVIGTDELLPAVAQGALGITSRASDKRVNALLQPLVDAPTAAAIRAERAMLAVLDGSCQTPIAGLAQIDANGFLVLRGLIAHPDGLEIVEAERRGLPAEADEIGRAVGSEILMKATPSLLAAIQRQQPHIYRVPSEDEP